MRGYPQSLVGNLYPPASIHSLEFNDETNAFRHVQTLKADASHARIAFDYGKKNVYGVSFSVTRIASYRVTSPTSVHLTKNLLPNGVCKGTMSAFIEAMATPPYYVFSASWPAPESCGVSFSADSNGSSSKVLDSWKYISASGVHGLTLNEVNGQQLIYSADLNGDLVWTHVVNRTAGKVSEVGRLGAGGTNMHPRHLVAHPKGKFLYVLMEPNNSLAQYELDEQNGRAVKQTTRYMFIPDGVDKTQYWSAEVMLSQSERYLWANARAQRDTKNTGYISAFLLGEDGHIIEQMFRIPTTTVGGSTNVISPASWSDEYAAMTDYPDGYVQMFNMEGRKETENWIEYTTARPVAKVDIGDEGCCANVI